jgi:hypothetical protein
MLARTLSISEDAMEDYMPEVLAAAIRSAGISPEEADAQAQMIYAKVLLDYALAGQPCGPGHKGMIRWLTTQQSENIVSTA